MPRSGQGSSCSSSVTSQGTVSTKHSDDDSVAYDHVSALLNKGKLNANNSKCFDVCGGDEDNDASQSSMMREFNRIDSLPTHV